MSKDKQRLGERAKPILEKIEEGLALPKCRACGCLHQALEAFEKALRETPGAEASGVREQLRAAAARLESEAYDCLGCETCLGAEATVLCAELFGEGDPGISGGHCHSPPAPESAPGCG